MALDNQTWACAIGIAIAAAIVSGCSVYDASLLTTTDASSPQDVAQDRPQDTRDMGVDSVEDAALDAPEASPDSGGDDSPTADVQTDTETDATVSRQCDQCKDLSVVRPPCLSGSPLDGPATTDLVFAVRQFWLGAGTGSELNEWRSAGYDRDCMITSPLAQPTTCAHAAEGSAAIVEDGEFGRDNSFGRNAGGQLRLLTALGFLPDIEVQGNERIHGGIFGLVVVISNYNGLSDDPQATVAVLPSMGVVDTAGQPAAANWDGNDLWSIDQAAQPAGQPLFITTDAYVAQDVVVARIDVLPLRLAANATELRLPLQQLVVTMHLSADRSQVDVGTFSAVIDTAQMVQAFDGYAAMVGVCANTNSDYADMRTVAQNSSDIRLDQAVNESLPCDATTMGMKFLAQAAKTGVVLPSAPFNPPSCDVDASTD